MRKLVEAGHVYIAQPPLYKLKRGKSERYVQTEDEMNEILIEFGCDGATLKTQKGKETFSEKKLAEFVKLLQGIESLENTLSHKALSLENYLAESAKHKAFPQYFMRVIEENTELFFVTDDELEKAKKKYAKLAPVVVDDEEELAKKAKKKAQAKEGEEEEVSEEAPVMIEPYEVTEILEAREFEKAKKKLEKFGLTLEQYLGVEGDGFTLHYEKKTQAAASLKQALALIKQQAKQGMNLQRYKGLGEMNPSQLWETTMDPATRTVLQVKLDDVVAADQIFTVLMGDNVESRRNFIERNARAVRNLDI